MESSGAGSSLAGFVSKTPNAARNERCDGSGALDGSPVLMRGAGAGARGAAGGVGAGDGARDIGAGARGAAGGVGAGALCVDDGGRGIEAGARGVTEGGRGKGDDGGRTNDGAALCGAGEPSTGALSRA